MLKVSRSECKKVNERVRVCSRNEGLHVSNEKGCDLTILFDIRIYN